MFEFFSQVIGFFELLFSLVVNALSSLAILIRVLINFVNLNVLLYPYLPAILLSSVMITIAIGVVKFVIGR